jgi:DNA polymerase elongation subunit (family B)
VYKIGSGGLHSTESQATHIAGPDCTLEDFDVRSYYPEIILRLGLYPPQMGEAFLSIYRSIVQKRLAAKDAGDKKKADMLKIVINGSFGKLGSKWSALYSPDLLVQVTLTGQLALLMLIEMLELSGISVVSANTDGIVMKTPRGQLWLRDSIVKWWETTTGFETENVEYRALFSRDVNNYVAFKLDGEAKLKGAYAPPEPVGGSWPNPANEICVDAVVAYLRDATPIESTVRACTDIRRFITIRTVKGGAVKYRSGSEIVPAKTVAGKREQLTAAGYAEVLKGMWNKHGDALPTDAAHRLAVAELRNGSGVEKDFLGKAIRWYYAVGEMGAINYALNGNRVPKTEGARPLMELPDTLPADIDYAWYIREAHSILSDMGTLR